MEECPFCFNMCSYECISCKNTLWKKPKIEHKYSIRRNPPENLDENNNSDYITRVQQNLINKLGLVNKCINNIINKTDILIENIQQMCIQSIRILKAKEYHYIGLINNAKNLLLEEERKNVQRELNTYIVIRIPTLKLKEVERFYSFDFVRVIEKTSKFKSIKNCDFKQLLKEEYNLFVECSYNRMKSFKDNNINSTALAITRDNNFLVSTSREDYIKVWNLQENRLEAALQSYTRYITKILLTSDNTYIVAISDDYILRIWNLQSKLQESALAGHTGKIKEIAISNDNRYIVSGSADNNIIIWSLNERGKNSVLQGHTGCVIALVITSDNNYIISGSKDHTVRIWNLQNKIEERVFQEHKYAVSALILSNDNQYIFSGSHDTRIRIFNLVNKSYEGKLKGHTSYITYIGATMDYKFIISASNDQTVRIWNFRDRTQETVFHDQSYSVIKAKQNYHNLKSYLKPQRWIYRLS